MYGEKNRRPQSERHLRAYLPDFAPFNFGRGITKRNRVSGLTTGHIGLGFDAAKVPTACRSADSGDEAQGRRRRGGAEVARDTPSAWQAGAAPTCTARGWAAISSDHAGFARDCVG